MKNLNRIICMMSCIMLFAECKKSVSNEAILTIKDAGDCEEVAFEDVATDIRIVPLISDEPLDGCNRVQCYGSTAFVRSNGGGCIYIFEDGKQIAKLDKIGRGPGEYNRIENFVYSPSTNILYIQNGYSSIIKYSFPELEYLGSFEIRNIFGCAEHDDSTLICRMEYEGVNGDYFVNSRNGQVRAMLKKVGGFFVMNDDMGYYSPKHRILPEIGSLNTISEVPAKIGDEEKIILKYNFGKDGWPEVLDSIDMNDINAFLEASKQFSDRQETLICETRFALPTDGSISFWYTVGLTGGSSCYFRLTGDEMVKYSGFKGTGTINGITPTGLTNDGAYVHIFEGIPESIFDDSGKRSSFTADLENAMKAQAFNNPVLVFYKIK